MTQIKAVPIGCFQQLKRRLHEIDVVKAAKRYK